MTKPLNLTLDEDLIIAAKAYAANKGMSLSKVVEHLLYTVVQPAAYKVDKLHTVDVPPGEDPVKEAFDYMLGKNVSDD